MKKIITKYKFYENRPDFIFLQNKEIGIKYMKSQHTFVAHQLSQSAFF